jgi:hypothetical protein
MSSREDSVGVEKGSTTEVASTALKRDDEREIASGSGGSTNNVLLATILPVWDLSGILRDSCWEYHSGDCEDGDKVFDLHLEWSYEWSDGGTEAGSDRLMVLCRGLAWEWETDWLLFVLVSVL